MNPYGHYKVSEWLIIIHNTHNIYCLAVISYTIEPLMLIRCSIDDLQDRCHVTNFVESMSHVVRICIILLLLGRMNLCKCNKKGRGNVNKILFLPEAFQEYVILRL